MSKWWCHPSAVVDDGAVVGTDTKIWHFCHIMTGARIGARCVIGQGCFVAASVVVGNNCHIQNNVSLYDGVVLEDDVFVGPSVVFTNVKTPRAYSKGKYQSTLVKKGATIGANSTIICGVEVGEYAFVGAGSVVTKDVPPHTMVYGVPAKEQKIIEASDRRL